MELKNMLEYQELDRKVFLLEKKLRESGNSAGDPQERAL